MANSCDSGNSFVCGGFLSLKRKVDNFVMVIAYISRLLMAV